MALGLKSRQTVVSRLVLIVVGVELILKLFHETRALPFLVADLLEFFERLLVDQLQLANLALQISNVSPSLLQLLSGSSKLSGSSIVLLEQLLPFHNEPLNMTLHIGSIGFLVEGCGNALDKSDHALVRPLQLGLMLSLQLGNLLLKGGSGFLVLSQLRLKLAVNLC